MFVSIKRLKQLQTASSKHDLDGTRSRLIEAASAIFAERGYQSATTREICVQARANAAAVNYHFGDKLGLYKAALESVIARQESGVENVDVSAMSPEAALRAFVYATLDHVGGCDAGDRYARLMAHELSEPTPGLALVVNQIILPRAKLLSSIIARLTNGSANSISTRLAAHSIMAQIVHYVHSRPVIKLLWPQWHLDAIARQSIADHVTKFSLAGLRDIARTKGVKRGKRQ